MHDFDTVTDTGSVVSSLSSLLSSVGNTRRRPPRVDLEADRVSRASQSHSDAELQECVAVTEKFKSRMYFV